MMMIQKMRANRHRRFEDAGKPSNRASRFVFLLCNRVTNRHCLLLRVVFLYKISFLCRRHVEPDVFVDCARRALRDVSCVNDNVFNDCRRLASVAIVRRLSLSELLRRSALLTCCQPKCFRRHLDVHDNRARAQLRGKTRVRHWRRNAR